MKNSTPDGNKTKSADLSLSLSSSNGRTSIGSSEQSKTKKRDRKSTASRPPINKIPADEMRAAILENTLPAALLALKSISSETKPTAHKISIMEAAQQRLEEANRWVRSASMSVESARKHLDAVTKARNAALNAKMEAAEFLRQVTTIHLPNALNETSRDNEEPIVRETKDNSVILDKRSNLSKIPSGVNRKEVTEKTNERICHELTPGVDQNTDNRISPEKHLKSSEQRSSDKTKSLPLKKRQSNVEVDEESESHQETTASNTPNSNETESSKLKNSNDDGIIHLKTTPAPSKQNRRFSDLPPEAKEILRKTVLSSLSNNGIIDKVAMERATNIGIPEEDVTAAVKVAWNKLRNTVANVAKGNNASSEKVLHGIELRGLGHAEFDGVYDRCTKQRKDDPDHPPSFQKKQTCDERTAVFRLYQTDVPGNWEISLNEEKKYTGTISRSKKASGDDSAKSFEREWTSVAGKVCSVTITPLYSERVI